MHDSSETNLLNSICKFEKGIEIGSKNYTNQFKDGFVRYLRVGDLDNVSSTFIKEELSKNSADEYDILIAFDGAPGRNAVGLTGSFSSGIYKVICNPILKGLIYFEINSKRNQKIIADHAQGTTILHASKSINHLECCKCSSEDIEYFDSLFNRIVELKKRISLLKIDKIQLLKKYF